MRKSRFPPEFVEFMPDEVQGGVLYVSMIHAIALHRCACGCGREVVTPLSPTGWQLYFDGKSITLTPSIGNWEFPCRSHYWIRSGSVCWAEDMPQWRIDQNRARDKMDKERARNLTESDNQLSEEPHHQALINVDGIEPEARSWRAVLKWILSWR